MTEPGRTDALRPMALILVALSALVWQGCAGPAARTLPQARLQAIKHNQRGVDAELKGNRDAALGEFSQALRLHSSIENWDGMVVAQVNIARTHRLRGELASARVALERALLLPESSGLAPEVFFENAKIHLAAGDLAAAQQWALKAAGAEQGSDLGRRLNLVGAVLFRTGSLDQARQQVEQALKLNRAQQVPAEEANSLRLLGEIHLAQGRGDQASAAFAGALLLDKNLGLGRKIALDLRGLGAAALQREDLAAGIGYYGRALEVSRSGGDAAAAADDLAKLAELHRRRGDTVTAQQLEEERARLIAKKTTAPTPVPARTAQGS